MSSSLTDAFLFEAPPYDVWIADLGPAAPAGSGTQADPWNGSSRNDTPMSISPSNISRSGLVVTVTLTNHGFQNGDMVTILGVTGSGNYFYYNGTFAVHSVSSGTFNYTMLGEPGSGSIGGTITCVREQERFDALMRAIIPANTTIHLGPGIFATKGFIETIAGGWKCKSGQKIIGAGMGVSTLRLVKASHPTGGTLAVFGSAGYSPDPPLTSVEISDFTVDCNIAGQPVPQGADWAPVCCGAVFLNGQHIRVRRIHAINYGTQNQAECFVIAVAGASPSHAQAVDCLIEECIIEQPAHNTVYMSTPIIISGGEDATTGRPAFHRSCAVRNCLINGDYVDNPVPIASISYSGTTATVTTRYPHGRQNGDWVLISGALENGAVSLVFNGWFQISNVASTTFNYTVAGPLATPTGEMWVGRWPSHLVDVDGTAASPSITRRSATIFRIKSVTPHFRRLGNNVLVTNVAVVTLPNAFLGAFKIHAIVSPTELDFVIPSDPDPGNIDWTNSHIFIGPTHSGISGDGGTTTVIEENRVYGCVAGFYHDTGTTKDLLIRNNHFYRVNFGVHQNMGSFSGPFNGVTSIAGSPNPARGGPDNNTATFKMRDPSSNQPHGFLPGQLVEVAGVKVGGSELNVYNGLYSIASTPSDYEFTYEMPSDPGANADTNNITPTYKPFGHVRCMMIENNLIELITNIHPHGYGQPWGMRIASITPSPPYTFLDTVIRGNIVRHADNAIEPTAIPVGIGVYNCQNAVIEANVVEINYYRAAFNNSCKNVKCFDNRTPAGELILGYNFEANFAAEEIATRLEDVLMLAI